MLLPAIWLKKGAKKCCKNKGFTDRCQSHKQGRFKISEVHHSIVSLAVPRHTNRICHYPGTSNFDGRNNCFDITRQ